MGVFTGTLLGVEGEREQVYLLFTLSLTPFILGEEDGRRLLPAPRALRVSVSRGPLAPDGHAGGRPQAARVTRRLCREQGGSKLEG